MSEIHVALSDLKELPRLLDNFTRQLAPKEDVEYFPKIRQLIVKLENDGLNVVQPTPPGPDVRLQWEIYRQGKSTGIDKVTLKRLCWASDVVHDPKFAEYLHCNIDNARSKVIKGLVWSLHLKWAQKLPKKEITEYTARQLDSYPGTDRALIKWKGDIITIIGENGPANFAKKSLLQKLISPKDASKEWALYESSEYIYSAVTYAMDDCVEKVSGSSAIIDYLFETLFIWTGWQLDRSALDITVKKLVFHPEVNQFTRRLLTAILSHPLLGDPRLPANRNNWVGIDLNARKQFIQWLSAADIHFFFDHVLKGHDPHGRRSFWLKYVSKLIGCRSLLSDTVAFQLRGNKDISFGRLSETQNKAAFILDFDKIVAVEFSGVGCVYLFTREEFDKSINDMWTDHHIREWVLKNQDLPRDRRVPHSGSTWEYKVKNVLASYGVRLFSSYGIRL
ncbi:MAG: EH signature domain-containing protein [Chlorobiales bacterium]|nr:EH signature domain-containing protein [Chlorobiales bacterium]